MERVCLNCARCSEHYPDFVDTCDVDGHKIEDVYTHGCELFVETEGTDDD